MEKLPACVFRLATANNELIVLNSHFEIIIRKAGDSQSDSQLLRPVFAFETLDIVGWIAIARLGDAFKRLFHAVKP